MNRTRALSDAEIKLMRNELDNPRDACMFLLGLVSGFRISELLSLKIDNLLEYDGTLKNVLTVSRADMKGKHESRSIPLSSETMAVVYEYLTNLPDNQEYLFQSNRGSKLSRIQAWRIIKTAANNLGFKGVVATHSFRKSFATRVYEKSGKDLNLTQKALRHSNINSTIKYLYLDEEKLTHVILDLYKD